MSPAQLQSRRDRISSSWALAAFVCILSFNAFAEESDDVHPFIAGKFYLQLGIFSPRKDIDISFDGSLGGENESIDFEEQLNLAATEDIFSWEFIWRFGEKWSLRTQHFKSDTQQRAVLEEDIEWGDAIIQAGSSVETGTSLELTRVFFGWSLDSAQQVDAGVGLGFHLLDTGAFINRDIITDFGELSAVSASGPLPNIGAWYYYSPSKSWVFGGRLDWFEASVGDYAGGITNVAIGANYQFAENIGFGVNYQLFHLGADIKKSTVWRGRLETAFQGTYFYLSGSW